MLLLLGRGLAVNGNEKVVPLAERRARLGIRCHKDRPVLFRRKARVDDTIGMIGYPGILEGLDLELGVEVLGVELHRFVRLAVEVEVRRDAFHASGPRKGMSARTRASRR